MATTDVAVEKWVATQTEATRNNASAMTSNSLTFKRSKLTRHTTDNKRSSEEIREDSDSWLSREDEDCNKKKREESESEDKEKKPKDEEKSRSSSSSEPDKKLRSEDKRKLSRLRFRKPTKILEKIKRITKKTSLRSNKENKPRKPRMT